ncbi:MAG: NACHT domain-containing NTPase [Symploca sp. SIO2B6]|nr:NACHT domain-containing NTPase [Symploca sp. SIO2B6]
MGNETGERDKKMGKRSLKASTDGQLKAKRAFDRTCWTQEQLAFEVGLNTRQSVWKFLTGRPVERHIFIDLCFQLDLEWEEIADFPMAPGRSTQPSSTIAPNQETSLTKVPSTLENWLQQLRDALHPHITQQCGILQSSLELGRPISLEKLYTPIRVLPHLQQQRWLDITDLQPHPSQPIRTTLAQANAGALDAVEILSQTPKALLFGKPGAGKTTFLKYLALQCIAGHYQPECVPVFITLRYGKSFGIESSQEENGKIHNRLLQEVHAVCGIASLSAAQIQGLLHQGSFLLLLDGWDEVSPSQLNTINQDIQSFTQRYPNNPCVITSRLTSHQPYLNGFLNLEVDDFNHSQVETFVKLWFMANLPQPNAAQQKTKDFLEALDLEENQPLKELVATPILLSLLCSVFLARSDFPKQRAKLYQAGLDILLKQWDQSRGIQRTQTYQQLSIADKLILLGTIAENTFKQNKYFFEKAELFDIISNYLKNDSDRISYPINQEALFQECEAILQSIQLQHGLIIERAKDIYSFSHLTFQEYLTARKILHKANSEGLTKIAEDLAIHSLNPQWHEVLQLTANMMVNSDVLLRAMHQTIERHLQQETVCAQYMESLNQKVQAIAHNYQPSAVRAFYLTLFGDRDLRLATALDPQIAQTLVPDLALDLALARTFEIGVTLVSDPSLDTLINLVFSLELDQKFDLTPNFQVAFTRLKQELPEPDGSFEPIQKWCDRSGKQWLETFQTLLIQYRQIGQRRSLSKIYQKFLYQYYQLNLLLVDCWKESQTTDDFYETLANNLLKNYEYTHC